MRHKSYLFIILSIALILSFFLALFYGAAKVSFSAIIEIIAKNLGLTSTQHPSEALIWNIRLPRLLNSFFAGAVLALSGAVMQALFKNPLADPSIIGISSGASLSASLAIVASGSFIYNFSIAGLSFLSLFTFGGAVLTSLLIFGISYQHKKADVPTMLMAGIAINALCGALIGVILFVSDDAQLRSITFWTLGSMGGSVWQQVFIMLLVMLIICMVLFPHAKDLNALALGEENAGLLGIHAEKLKRKIILCTSLGVGTAVAFFGIIGFIGLVVPHIIRLLAGPDNRIVMPASLMGGAVLLSLADTLARTLAAPAELPIGIITAIGGAPLFLYLLIKNKKISYA